MEDGVLWKGHRSPQLKTELHHCSDYYLVLWIDNKASFYLCDMFCFFFPKCFLYFVEYVLLWKDNLA